MILDFRFFACISILTLLGEGCIEKQVLKSTSIFDFQSFFDKEAALLDSKHIGFTKTIIDKEDVFSNNEKSPDWEKELSVFKSFSLIKPQQEELYDIDTLKSERGFKFITYSANNTHTQLQLAEVMFNPENKIEKITLVVKSDSGIGNSDIVLTYLPQKGYDIKGDINSKITGINFLDVHVSCN